MNKTYYNDLMNWNYKSLNFDICTLINVPNLVDVDTFGTTLTIYSKVPLTDNNVTIYKNRVEEILVKYGFPENVKIGYPIYACGGSMIFEIQWKDAIIANNDNYKKYNDEEKSRRKELNDQCVHQ